MAEAYSGLIVDLVAAFATFYLVAVGQSIVEKSGVLNLAIDGVFFLATGAAVYGAVSGLLGFKGPLVGTLVAGVVALVFGLFFNWITTVLPLSQGALGLSLMFVGYGLGIVIGYPARMKVGNLADYVYPADTTTALATLLAVVALGVTAYFMLERTGLGTAIRACGENPHAATSMGVDVVKTRLVAGALGFLLIGIGSSFFPLMWLRGWDVKSYVLGYGWVAYTIALAAGRHILLLIPFSLVIGGLFRESVRLQAVLGIPVDLSKAVPYTAALIAMTLYSMTRLKKTLTPPSSLGKPFYREEKTI